MMLSAFCLLVTHLCISLQNVCSTLLPNLFIGLFIFVFSTLHPSLTFPEVVILSLVRSEVVGEEEVVCSWPGAHQPFLHDRAAPTLPLSTRWWVKTGFPWTPQETPSQGSSEMGDDRWGVVTHKGGWSCQREPNAENQKAGSAETPPANLESFPFGLTLTFLIASWRLALLRRAAEESWNV